MVSHVNLHPYNKAEKDKDFAKKNNKMAKLMKESAR